ncbi:sulfite exporter TauE/SafE family protein [Brachybacterium sp. YJGR34]|uniref:sulfite exporter TauE/SafE family protein n=1 Tax=Brachybacterium sp. YJGR34 TaxID=2059911 RepID=UPI000E0C74DF|nr:sulfite exporter TauE/SafE family protein [Brachybacterium sp. YJGR34]
MEPVSLIVLLVMGTLAGAINAAVGSGSLLTLPVLLALGVPPGVAVRTNTIGILFSTIGSTYGYRREIAQEKGNLGPLVLTTALCATAGALLLLISPSEALDVVVPVLIVVALAMVIFQKPLTTALRRRAERRAARSGGAEAPGAEDAERSPLRSRGLLGAMGAASIYGGYFTAAQGILYLGVLGIFTGRTMGSVNGVKNLMSLVVNLAAATVYVVAHFVLGVEVLWIATAAIAVGALLGGYFGAHLAKRLPEVVLRGIIVVVALVALVRQVL